MQRKGEWQLEEPHLWLELLIQSAANPVSAEQQQTDGWCAEVRKRKKVESPGKVQKWQKQV